jgi:hypothetical protein
MNVEKYETLTFQSGQTFLTWFKENWSKVSIIVSIFLTIYLVVIVLPKSTLMFAILMCTPLYMLHEIDEYVFPGGFAQFMNKNIYKAEPENGPVTFNAVFWINVVAVWTALPLFSLWAMYDITQALALPYFFIFQAILHLILGIIGKRIISPGMITAWLIHVPWGIWTIWLLFRAKILDNPYWNGATRFALYIVLALGVAGQILLLRYKRRIRNQQYQ